MRDRRGLLGADVAASGVDVPAGGEEPVEERLGGTLPASGARLLSRASSGLGLAPGMGMGSDMSKMGLRWAVEEETPKDTLRSRLPPLRTSPSAMVGREDERRRREEEGGEEKGGKEGLR